MPESAVRSSQLRDRVRQAYSAAANGLDQQHAFPIGRDFAESLGYPSVLLSDLPAVASEAFAGVSNVPRTISLFHSGNGIQSGRAKKNGDSRRMHPKGLASRRISLSRGPHAAASVGEATVRLRPR